jgi:hypothetical protein
MRRFPIIRALNPLVIWVIISSVHWFKRWLGTMMTLTAVVVIGGGLRNDEK